MCRPLKSRLRSARRRDRSAASCPPLSHLGDADAKLPVSSPRSSRFHLLLCPPIFFSPFCYLPLAPRPLPPPPLAANILIIIVSRAITTHTLGGGGPRGEEARVNNNNNFICGALRRRTFHSLFSVCARRRVMRQRSSHKKSADERSKQTNGWEQLFRR